LKYLIFFELIIRKQFSAQNDFLIFNFLINVQQKLKNSNHQVI